jgi:hypothetical protein
MPPTMKPNRPKRLLRRCVIAAVATTLSSWTCARSIPNDEMRQRVERTASALAEELARMCPASGRGDQAAFDACRKALFQRSELKRSMADFVMWGRQRDPKLSLKETKLTQFAPDVLAGMYLPLFMFNGKHRVEYVEHEGLFQIRLETAFRNGLPPGQFPYPFWHEAEKWAMYQNANEIVLWWDAKADRIKAAQFTVFGPNAPVTAAHAVAAPAFDGQWTWTDDKGKTQPAVTVFDGLFRADNPFIGKLETAYKSLALQLRESQCMQCHVPNNPDGTKRLVLLQSPAHAAAEIKRVIKSVMEDRMPRNEFGAEEPLDEHAKATLLKEGAAFARVVDAAKDWEAKTQAAVMPAQAN